MIINKFNKIKNIWLGLSFKHKSYLLIFGFMILMIITAPDIDNIKKDSRGNTNETQSNIDNEIKEDDVTESNTNKTIEVKVEDIGPTKNTNFNYVYKLIIDTNNIVKTQYSTKLVEIDSIDYSSTDRQIIINQLNDMDDYLQIYRKQFIELEYPKNLDDYSNDLEEIKLKFYNTYGLLNNTIQSVIQFVNTGDESVYDDVNANLTAYEQQLDSVLQDLEVLKDKIIEIESNKKIDTETNNDYENIDNNEVTNDVEQDEGLISEGSEEVSDIVQDEGLISENSEAPNVIVQDESTIQE